MVEVYPENVGLIRVVSVFEEDDQYSDAFLNREVPCAFKDGTTYVALLDHALQVIRDQPEATKYFMEQAGDLSGDEQAFIHFDARNVEEEVTVMTWEQFEVWCNRQLN